MPRLEHRRRLRLTAPLAVLLAAVFTALFASCGAQNGTLPDATVLLNDSAAAMNTVTSASFDLQVDGTILDIPIKSAQGQLTSDGSAKGVVLLDMGAQPYEMAFVVLAEEVYLQGPTGGFQKLSSPPDLLPTRILLPGQGISAVLTSGTDATTEGREEIGGVDTYRVRVTFPEESLGQFVPAYAADQPSRVWIATDDYRVVQGEFPTTEGTITFRFFDYDAPADITAPI